MAKKKSELVEKPEVDNLPKQRLPEEEPKKEEVQSPGHATRAFRS